MSVKFIHIVFIVLLVPVFGFSQQVKKEIRQGNREYDKEVYDEAELLYRKALEKKPESAPANYNLANSLYKQEQYEAAATKFETLLPKATSKEELSKYFYNLGNTYFKSQKLEKSIEAYKQSLRLNPSDADARHNLYLAKSMMDQQQQEQEQEQEQDKDKDKDKEQEQDQQNKDNQEDNKNQQNKKDQQEQQQQQQQQISKEDAEALLEALEQDEKDVMEKLQEQKAAARKIPVEKEW